MLGLLDHAVESAENHAERLAQADDGEGKAMATAQFFNVRCDELEFVPRAIRKQMVFDLVIESSRDPVQKGSGANIPRGDYLKFVEVFRAISIFVYNSSAAVVENEHQSQ